MVVDFYNLKETLNDKGLGVLSRIFTVLVEVPLSAIIWALIGVLFLILWLLKYAAIAIMTLIALPLMVVGCILEYAVEYIICLPIYYIITGKTYDDMMEWCYGKCGSDKYWYDKYWSNGVRSITVYYVMKLLDKVINLDVVDIINDVVTRIWKI